MSEDPNFSIEWHKGFQIGLYSGISKERERIISLLKIEEKRLYDHGNIEGSYLVTGLIELIKGENK